MDTVTTARSEMRRESARRIGAQYFESRVISRALALFRATLFLASFGYSSAFAQQSHPTESQVKAAYLYNFGKFVRWQTDRVVRPDLLICVLGKDPFGPVLDSTVEGESIDGRKLSVRRIEKVQDASPCSILFISSSEEDQLAPILASAQRFGALTVSDIPRFAERGGIIGFVLQQEKVRFEVNRGAAELAHLSLSSELLKVASKLFNKVPEN